VSDKRVSVREHNFMPLRADVLIVNLVATGDDAANLHRLLAVVTQVLDLVDLDFVLCFSH
jgi:hypothetical protein